MSNYVGLLFLIVLSNAALSSPLFLKRCLAVFSSFYKESYRQEINTQLIEELLRRPNTSMSEVKKGYLIKLGFSDNVAKRLIEERPDLVDEIIFSPFRNRPVTYYRGISIEDFKDFDRFHPSTKIWVTKKFHSAKSWGSRIKTGHVIILRYQIPPMFITSGGPRDGQEEIMLQQPMIAIFTPPYINPNITRDQKLFLEAYLDKDSSSDWIKVE